MSASDEWRDYHLTPRGWVEGSNQVDIKGETIVEVPKDAVQTSRYSEYYSSIYSRPKVGHQVTWEIEDKQLIAQLRERFGDPPSIIG